ncbi:MAG: diguanylate cyclase [Lachnospiraceae bacterium]|nr:diguanylate cyclase [Lachnospiraceae bacterium]
MEMTVELFDSIINTSQDCVFWKDKERRFLGVNQAFLDFYGFDSVDVLVGKTDEDMGWHSDPEPFKQDELMVLSGRSTYKVQGKCFIRGEERDIVASKRPLYEDGKIVGLVGSFVDITNVLRHGNALDHSQVVYTIDKLRKYSFFDRIIDSISLEEILDPLTGILSRAYSIKFVHDLIESKTPFTFAMIDLDNFKAINDSFGHGAGDYVLTIVSKELAEFTEGYGLVGRFGGDELLLINLRDVDAQAKNDFFEKLYSGRHALRVDMEFDNRATHITGTTGAASFPGDAEDFTDLFSLIDKMLYLGKSRGRNCYYIYDHEKHRNVEISKIAGMGIFSNMKKLKSDLEKEDGFEGKLRSAIPVVTGAMQISDLYYVLSDGRLKAVCDEAFDADASDISDLSGDEVFSESTLDLVKKNSPKFYGSLRKAGFESVLTVRIGKGDNTYGYLVCAVKRALRLWQEDECAVLYYLAGLLAEDLQS